MPDGVTIIGNAVTGTGDARGIDLPMEARGDGSDIFDRIEAGRARRAVQSPFGPPDQRIVTPPTRAQKAARKSDEQRFVAPAIEDEEPRGAAVGPVHATVDAHQPTELVRDPVSHMPPPADDARRTRVDGEPGRDLPRGTGLPVREPGGDPSASHDPRCGQPLTGGGAPRGWVLVRVIGQGQPQRYCSPACAIAVLDDAHWPGDVQPRTESVPPADTSRPRPPRTRVARADDLATDIIRRYAAGATVNQIADTGVASRATVGRVIRAAAAAGQVQKRDDRATGSGGNNRIEYYPPELVDQVRHLYLDEHLTQSQVGQRLGVGQHVVQRLMLRHEIPTRPPANITADQGLSAAAVADIERRYVAGEPLEAIAAAVGCTQPAVRHRVTAAANAGRLELRAVGSGSRTVSDLVKDAGVTSLQIKQWAVAQGLITVVTRGTPARHLVDAYLAAHERASA